MFPSTDPLKHVRFGLGSYPTALGVDIELWRAGTHWRRGLTDRIRGRFKRPGGMEVKHIWLTKIELRLRKTWGIRSLKWVGCPEEYGYADDDVDIVHQASNDVSCRVGQN